MCINAYCSDQYVWGFLCNTYCLFSMLPDRGRNTCWLRQYNCLPKPSIIRIVILDVLLRTIRIELPSLNYYSLGRWLLLWKAGYASSIGGGWHQCWPIHYVIQSPFSISITTIIINGLIHRTLCHRVNAAIRIARPICLSRRQQYVLPEQYVIA